jgi:hypothetical protein
LLADPTGVHAEREERGVHERTEQVFCTLIPDVNAVEHKGSEPRARSLAALPQQLRESLQVLCRTAGVVRVDESRGLQVESSAIEEGAAKELADSTHLWRLSQGNISRLQHRKRFARCALGRADLAGVDLWRYM